MRIFNLDKTYNIVCDTKSTRNGFKHVATLHRNGVSIFETKCNYINRTWERFTYETILKDVVKECFIDKNLKKYLGVIKKES